MWRASHLRCAKMNYELNNFDLRIGKFTTQNSKFKIHQFKIAHGDNSKLKNQKSKFEYEETALLLQGIG